MRYLPFVLKHLRHNWIRTASTVLAMVVCIFLFCTLQTILEAVNWGLRSANASRLIVRNAVSLFYSLPLTYKEKIQAVPGVKNVAKADFWLLAFGGPPTSSGTPATPSTPRSTSPYTPSTSCRPGKDKLSSRIAGAASSVPTRQKSSVGRSATPSSWRIGPPT